MKKYFCLFLLFFSIYNFYIFFSWYLGDKRIFIEDAFWLSIYASIPMYCFIFFIHLFFYPKNTNDYAEVLTFPPTLMLFSMNTAFFISSINRYHFQIYDLPKFFDFLRFKELGIFFIVIALILITLAFNEFKEKNEDPNPTTSSETILSKGIYKITRNPIYLGFLFFQLGVGMALHHVHISIFTILTFVVFNSFIIKPEENYLEKKFKGNYLNYKKRVRRWL